MKDQRTFFTVSTPEHVPLRMALAEPGTRFVACLIDFFVILMSVILLQILLVATGLFLDEQMLALVMVISFLLRTFYFMVGEVWGRGQTWGKKKMGLRVIAADGGPLTAEQVVARNLTREFELFFPLVVMLLPGQIFPEAPSWVSVAVLIWIGGMGLLPVITHRRARAGDFLAGTVVVVEPQAELQMDLADSGAVAPAYSFTPRQLDIYGIKELQALEGVLRRHDSMSRDELLRQILDRVVTKIDWPDTVPYIEAEQFLQAFYAAQRHRLENQMLMGKRREEKVR